MVAPTTRLFLSLCIIHLVPKLLWFMNERFGFLSVLSPATVDIRHQLTFCFKAAPYGVWLGDSRDDIVVVNLEK